MRWFRTRSFTVLLVLWAMAAHGGAGARASESSNWATDPAGDVHEHRWNEESSSSPERPGSDLLGWGVVDSRVSGGSTLTTLVVELAGQPDASGFQRVLVDSDDSATARWWIRMGIDGPEFLRNGDDGGFWQHACPGASGSLEGGRLTISFDTACIGAPESMTLHPYVGESEEGVGYWRDEPAEPLRVQFPASGQRLSPPPSVDTSESCQGAKRGRFADSERNVHGASIDCVAHLGITHGKSDSEFAPHDALTRGHIATFVLRTLASSGIAVPAGDRDVYDGDDGHRHERSINALTEMGMFYSDSGTVDLDEVVTRAEMALWVDKALLESGAWGQDLAPDYFGDDDHHAGSMLELRINRVAAAGIAGGQGRGRYGPDVALRRDAMATFLTRLHARLADADPRTAESGWWRDDPAGRP